MVTLLRGDLRIKLILSALGFLAIPLVIVVVCVLTLRGAVFRLDAVGRVTLPALGHLSAAQRGLLASLPVQDPDEPPGGPAAKHPGKLRHSFARALDAATMNLVEYQSLASGRLSAESMARLHRSLSKWEQWALDHPEISRDGCVAVGAPGGLPERRAAFGAVIQSLDDVFQAEEAAAVGEYRRARDHLAAGQRRVWLFSVVGLLAAVFFIVHVKSRVYDPACDGQRKLAEGAARSAACSAGALQWMRMVSEEAEDHLDILKEAVGHVAEMRSLNVRILDLAQVLTGAADDDNKMSPGARNDEGEEELEASRRRLSDQVAEITATLSEFHKVLGGLEGRYHELLTGAREAAKHSRKSKLMATNAAIEISRGQGERERLEAVVTDMLGGAERCRAALVQLTDNAESPDDLTRRAGDLLACAERTRDDLARTLGELLEGLKHRAAARQNLLAVPDETAPHIEYLAQSLRDQDRWLSGLEALVLEEETRTGRLKNGGAEMTVLLDEIEEAWAGMADEPECFSYESKRGSTPGVVRADMTVFRHRDEVNKGEALGSGRDPRGEVSEAATSLDGYLDDLRGKRTAWEIPARKRHRRADTG